MITCFMVRCRSFIWFLIIAFTICSIPHFELVPSELADLLSGEAYAAQDCSAGSCPVREYVYDARSRIVTDRQLLEDGRVFETRHSYSGFSTTKTDPDGRMKTETRDYVGRVVRMEEPFEGRVLRIAYTYNAAGDLLNMTDHQGNVTAMAYDSLGRRTSLMDPHTGVWKYAYNKNGHLMWQIDPRRIAIYFIYDKLNRVVRKYMDEKEIAVYKYDGALNGNGRQYEVTGGSITDRVESYDAAGRVTSRIRTYGDIEKQYRICYGYDDSGRVRELDYPDGYKVLYNYHSGTSLLKGVKGSDGRYHTDIADYNAMEQMAQINYGNGTATRYGYDPVSLRLNSIVTVDKSHLEANDLQRMSYGYSAGGNITLITDDLKGVAYEYQYDALQRLTKEMGTGGGPWMAHGYDDAGNLLTRTLGQTQMAYHYDDPIRKDLLTGITVNGTVYHYRYDGRGNLVEGADWSDLGHVGSRTIVYDAEGLPVTISNTRTGFTVDMEYDAQGIRALKRVRGGMKTVYAFPHYEEKGGVATKYIFANGTRIAKVESGNVKYLHPDHLGAPLW